MKKLKLFLSLLMLIAFSVGNAWAQAAAGTTLFSENFGGYSDSDVPSGVVSAATNYRVIYGNNATVTYTCTNGAGTKPGSTYVTTANSGNLAGGTSPEIMVGKKGTGDGAAGGSFSIAGIPSGEAKEITVTYKQNAQNLSVSVSGTGYTGSISGKPTAAGERTFDITVADGAAATFTLTFQAAATSNVRVDDILVTVKTAGEGGSEDVIVKTLKSISVAGQTTTYDQYAIFSFDGTCTATYSVTKNDVAQDDEQKVVTPTSVTSPDMTTAGNKTITVSYSENEVTKTTTYDITVNTHIVTPGTYDIDLSNTLFGVSTGSNATEQRIVKNDITLVAGCLSTATNKTYYDSGHIRFYADSYFNISAPSGFNITSIVFTVGGTWNGDKITTSTGTYTDGDTKTWSGEAAEVDFSFAGQCRISSISVTYCAPQPGS